ncbi:MAG: hypothetical protein U0M06_03755 [Clostridia bacterium]|nr:hypothetical protein [Clostridia bacterium]
MKGKEIYKAALNILSETNESSLRSDYEERYPYILALFYGEAEETDKRYRLANKLPQAALNVDIEDISEEDMPLCDVFASAAAYYLAAMLIIDENFEFSDRLFEKYASRMAGIYASLPGENEKIKNVYY